MSSHVTLPLVHLTRQLVHRRGAATHYRRRYVTPDVPDPMTLAPCLLSIRYLALYLSAPRQGPRRTRAVSTQVPVLSDVL